MKQISDIEMTVLEKPEIACGDVRKLAGSYVDGELTPTLHGRLKEHIATCSTCREFEESYRMVVSVAAEIGRDESENKLDAGVRRRLRAALNERLGIRLT